MIIIIFFAEECKGFYICNAVQLYSILVSCSKLCFTDREIQGGGTLLLAQGHPAYNRPEFLISPSQNNF